MAQIISKIINCTEVTTAEEATLTNNNTNYSISGIPGTTSRLFSKTVTASANHIFKQEPTVDFSETNNPNNYFVSQVDVVNDSNITARTFIIDYLFPFKNSSDDIIYFNSEAESNIANSTGKIYNYDLNVTNIINTGDNRNLVVYGDVGATLTVEVKIAGGANIPLTTAVGKTTSSGSTIVNLKYTTRNIYVGMTVTGTGVSSGTTVVAVNSNGKQITLSSSQTLASNILFTFSGSFTAVIGSNGTFNLDIFFPSTSSAISYNVILTQIASNSFSGRLLGQSPKTIAIKQFPLTVVTFGVTQTDTTPTWVLSAVSFTNSGKAESNNTLNDDYKNTIISFTASTTAAEIVKTSTDFTPSVWSPKISAIGDRVALAGGTVVSFNNLSIAIDNSGSTKIATITCDATVYFHGTSNTTTNLNVDLIITTP